MPVSISDQLRVEQLNLERLQRERDTIVGRWQQQLQDAQKRNLVPARIEEIHKRIETSKSIFERGISRAEARIAELEVKLTAQKSEKQQQAQASLEQLRSKARDTWLQNGGDPSKFDSAWEDMKTELLKQRTIDSLYARPARITL